jgi:hypothetical protein
VTRFSPAVASLTLFILVSSPTAQERPDFSGRWVAVEPASAAGHELRITQDQIALRLEQVGLDPKQTFDQLGRRQGPAQGNVESTTYRLDGKPTIGAGTDQQVRSSLRWDKNRLMLVDNFDRVRFERRLTLDGQGRLIVERLRPAAPADQPSDEAASRIVEPTRIVFEKRP